MTKAEEYKTKIEEYKKLLAEEETRVSLGEPEPLFLEHMFADVTKPEYGPCWGKARPLVESDFLPLQWKVDGPNASSLAITRGGDFFPDATCTLTLKPLLVAEVKAKGGLTSMSTCLMNIIAREVYSARRDPKSWDGTCATLVIYGDQKTIHLARYKTEEKRLAVANDAAERLAAEVPERGPVLAKSHLRSLNDAISNWLGGIRKNYEENTTSALLSSQGWAGGFEAILKEAVPNNTFASQIVDIKAAIKRIGIEICDILALAVTKHIAAIESDEMPKEIRDKLLDRLRSKRGEAIDYDPFHFPCFPRR